MACTDSGGFALERAGVRVLEQVREAVAIITPDIRFAWVNEEFTRLTGYGRDEIVGEPVTVLRSGMHPDTHYESMLRILHAEGHWQGEVWRRRKSGEAFPALLTISAIHDEYGEVEFYVDFFLDIDQVRYDRERLEFLVNHDALTELPNRRLFEDRLDGALRRAGRNGSVFAVIFVDLDGFKAVNDRAGHHEGDRLLIRVAGTLRGCLRDADTVARVGGDEFLILLEDCEGEHEALDAIRRLDDALDSLWGSLPEGLAGGASIGYALYPRDGGDSRQLCAAADHAMYGAKRGRGGA